MTTPSTSAQDIANDQRVSETKNSIFSKNLLAIITGKDAILKEERDCVIKNDEESVKDISSSIYLNWSDMSVRHGCFRIDERIALPKTIRDAELEDTHSSNPGKFALLSLAQNKRWPIIYREILAKANEGNVCTEIVNNLKPVTQHNKWSLLPNCIEKNDKLQGDLGGPINNEKGIEQNFFTGIDHYSNCPTI